MKSLLFIDVSNPIDTWKEVIEKVLLLHHLLYLFECITHSSLLSLEDIELIVILSY